MARDAELDRIRIETGELSIREVVRRGVHRDDEDQLMVLPEAESLERLMQERRIRVYLGIDPTAPDLHLGHAVPLGKLRQLQEAGHEVILLFGTFTARIGDPSDKTAQRVRLTKEQVEENMRTYVQQAGKILDMSPESVNPIRVVGNADWLDPMTFEDVLELMAAFDAQDILQRQSFRDRLFSDDPKKRGRVNMIELLYGPMQAKDALELGVDLEVGGRDQVFNMLLGRQLMAQYGLEKWVMGVKLLEDPVSGKKMSKSEGTSVELQSLPGVKYEVVMGWPDEMIPMGIELLTRAPWEVVWEVQEWLDQGLISPRDLKRALAFRIVSDLDGLEAAVKAEADYDRVARGELPMEMIGMEVPRGTGLIDVLVRTGLAGDEKEAKKRLAQGSVFVNGAQIKTDMEWLDDEGVVQIGKKTIGKIRRIRTI